MFKDSLAHRSFKCELIEPLEELVAEDMASDELTWIVRLNELNKPSSVETSINKRIIEFNQHELLVLENKAASRNKFSSIDIRVESGTVGSSSQLVKTHCSETNANLVSNSSSFSASNNDKHTDSDSTTKAGCDEQAHIASSVNSFSEKFEVREQQGSVQSHKDNASSLPNIQSMSLKPELGSESIKEKQVGQELSKAESASVNSEAVHSSTTKVASLKVDSNNNGETEFFFLFNN